MDRTTTGPADHGPVLVLGGTTDGRELATLLVAAGIPVTSSLAGRVTQPNLPPGGVRIGGFGGTTGLIDFLRSHAITAVVDATHPFAEHITAHAALACDHTGTPLLRLARPSWSTRAQAATWHWADGLTEARIVAEGLGSRIFLAIGRQDLHRFASWEHRYVLTRVITAPESALPESWEVISARGPFRCDDEQDLMRSRNIQVLVTKDSGGPTTAKLDAATALNIPVVIVRRPALPAGLATVSSPREAFSWAARIRGNTRR